AELRAGHHAIVPGDLAKSALIERINATDQDDLMPPPKTGKHLTPEQKELLRKWIEQGANYDTHWSYVKPRRPPTPDVKDKGRVILPADNCTQARREEETLPHPPEAAPRPLLRRLSYALPGLPPTPQEVHAFEHDPAPDAYEKQVDRLLASPQYGERM